MVSEEVAYEMAQGVANVAKSEVGVGETGVAGPGGGTAKKPVGMVCFGCAFSVFPPFRSIYYISRSS